MRDEGREYHRKDLKMVKDAFGHDRVMGPQRHRRRVERLERKFRGRSYTGRDYRGRFLQGYC